MASLRPARSFDDWRTGRLSRSKALTSSLPPSPSSLERKPFLCFICHMLLTRPECQGIAREDPEHKYWVTRQGRILHQPSFAALWASAYQWCYICSAIYNRVIAGRSVQEVETQYIEQVFETLWEFVGVDGEFLDVTLAGRLAFIIRTPLVTFRRIPRPGTTRYIPLSPLLDQSIKGLITGWLNSCQKNHLCRPPAIKWMPTRLLAVQQDRPDIKLVCFDNDAPARPYATLSHVWGKHKHTVLETSNIEAFKSLIPNDALPKCFQQAVFVARLLGIQYLWIDSLCILQNSAEDWSREAALMVSVYGNSTINIAMSFVTDSSGGCFNARKLEQMRVPIVNYVGNYSVARDGNLHNTTLDDTASDDGHSQENDHSGEDDRSGEDEQEQAFHGIIPREPQLVGFVEDQRWWQSHPSNGPLETRAWILQERLLSPRVLYLTDEQAFWECLEVGCCEVFPDGVPLNYMSQEWRRVHDPFKFSTPFVGTFESYLSHRQYFDQVISDSYKPSEDFCPDSELDSHWQHIVKEFCKRKLTFNKDKLVALSGIASAIRARTGDKYLAGIWQSTLPRSLLWTAYSSLVQETPGPYRAPSWSWASVDSDMIDLHSYEEKTYPDAEPSQPVVEVVGVDMEYASGNDMAEPISAVLHLRGHLYTLLSPEEVRKGMGLADLPLRERVVWEMYYKFNIRAKNGEIFQMQDKIQIDPARSGSTDVSDTDALFEQRVFVLPILEGHLSLNSLILVRQNDGLFRRIGATFADVFYGNHNSLTGLRFDRLRRKQQDDWDEVDII